MKKITKLLVLLVLSIIISKYLEAQVPIDGSNYFQIYNTMESYFSQKAQDLGVEYWEVEGHKEFQRWAYYFENKYSENGDFEDYPEALKEYFNSNNDFLPEDQPDWEYIGHDGIYQRMDGSYSCSVGQGNITSIWVDDSDPNYILAGGHYGSLWRTTNGGDDWECISNSEPLINGLCSIMGDPTDHNRIYVTSAPGRQNKGGGYSFGLFITEDGGLTWINNQVYIPGFGNLYFSPHFKDRPVKWIINPLDANNMFLITWTQLLRSTDGGVNWEVLLDKTNDYEIWGGRGFKDMLFDPVDPSTIYISGVEVHKLTNNGDEIENLTDEITQYSTGQDGFFQILMDAHPNYSDKIWFAIKSHDGGTDNLVYLNTANNEVTLLYTETGLLDYYKMQCEISPVNQNHLLIGGGGPSIKMFMGETQPNPINTISKCSPPDNWTHSDVRDANIIDDGNGEEKIYVGNDGGVFTAQYNVAINDWDWDYIANDGTNGIRNSELHGFDCSNSTDDILYAGFQDMNCAININNVWYNILGADGGTGLIDKTDPDYMYLSNWNSPATFYKSNNGWQSKSFLFTTNDHSKPPIAMNLSNPNEIYIGDKYELQKFPTVRDNNYHYPVLTIAPDNYNPGKLFIKEIAVSESNPDILYVSTDRFFVPWEGNPPPTHEKAIYKIMDDGQTIIDLSENLFDALKGGPVTGIAINAFDENEIWACFGTTANSTIPNEKKKVYHSTDGGYTWDAMAEGLPEKIPANDIKYEKQSGILYLVNDVGVYYYNEGLGSWLNITNDGPTSMVNSRIEFNHVLNKIRIGTFGRGIWQTDIPCIANNDTLYVSTTQTWDNVKHIQSDIIIQPGAILTITSNVYMAENKRIIVKRNAQLIIDGGTLTNACGNLWQGIEVWGTYDQPQDYAYQGFVKIINGGVIENAICGIQTIKVDEETGNLDQDYTGGMVWADGAVFRNCRTATSFWPYSYEPGLSFFRDCQFVTNDDLLPGTDPGFFIKTSGMSKLLVLGSSFTDTHTVSGPGELTSGIESHDTYLKVYKIGGQQCVFMGLLDGIRAYAHNPEKTVSITDSKFDDNVRSVYLGSIDNATVTGNEFYTWADASPLSQYETYCLYLDQSTGYKVEENYFQNTYSPGPLGIGLVVNESGIAPNEVYRNYFTNMGIGILAQDRNRGKDDGLQLRCNDFDHCTSDEVVTKSSPVKYVGIAPSQGAPTSNPEDMAGNLFYIPSPTPNGDYDDILNEGNHITYYYPLNAPGFADRVKPVDYTQSTVEAVGVFFPFKDWTYDDGCPPSEEPGGGGGIGVIKGKMASAGLKADSTKMLLAMLIDGGNTETVQADVGNSLPPETMQVYDELMAKSPYLSDTVISTAIEKEEVLPGAMIRDIMVANPKAAKSEKLMSKLDERWDPLPEYMKAQILAGRSIVSIREETESRLAAFKQERAKQFNAIARYYLNDTINPVASMDSLKALYENENSPTAKYGLAFLSAGQGEWSEGLVVLNNVPVQFGLSAGQAAVHAQMSAYYNLLMDLAQEGKSILEMDAAQTAALVDIEASGASPVSAYARNILLALGQSDYTEPIILPDILKSSAAEEGYAELLGKAGEIPGHISIRPNPARDYVVIAYDLEKEGRAIAEIHDMGAKLKYTGELKNKQDQLTVDTRGWKPGVYVLSLKINGKLVDSVKFTVID